MSFIAINRDSRIRWNFDWNSGNRFPVWCCQITQGQPVMSLCQTAYFPACWHWHSWHEGMSDITLMLNFDTQHKQLLLVRFHESIVTLRQRQCDRQFSDDNTYIVNLTTVIFWFEFRCVPCVPKGPINNIPALVQIMAWRRLVDDKSLSVPIMV